MGIQFQLQLLMNKVAVVSVCYAVIIIFEWISLKQFQTVCYVLIITLSGYGLV